VEGEEAQQLNQGKSQWQKKNIKNRAKRRKRKVQSEVNTVRKCRLVVGVAVGVACDKLQKITCYIVNNNKYIAQTTTTTTTATLCQGCDSWSTWLSKLHVVFQHQHQHPHPQQQQHPHPHRHRHQQRLIPGNENLYKFEKSDNILLLLAIKTT